jgi:hypothetical protein
LAALLGRQRRGFYIDVGAWDPVQDSVTKYFYDRGWHGINIEPNPLFSTLLREARPRDITLPIALSDAPGELDLLVIGRTGLATFEPAVADYAAAWAVEQRHWEGGIETVRVPVSTLAAVCRPGRRSTS